MSFASSDERYFATLVNRSRADLGLDPLRIEMHLNDSADDHSQWMLARNVFSHTGAGGSSSRQRMEAAGFDLAGGWMTAENIAYLGVTGRANLRDEIRTLHQMLMDSPGHYANIVNPDATVIGIGLKVGTFTVDGRDHTVLMATQNFGHTEGDLQIDNGRFANGRLQSPDLDPGSRSDWRADFDGEVIAPRPGGRLASGGRDNDDFWGRAGADVVEGRGGNDWLAGRAGRDEMAGGKGSDHLWGNRGADTLRGGDGHDTLMGGAGRDQMAGGDGRDLMRGGAGNDRLGGAAGNDRLDGQGGADRLIGGAGADWLSGGTGGDRLVGGSGADTLTGGKGDDLLIGGGGADSFVFAEGDGADRIKGYQQGTDRLLIEAGLTGRDAVGFAEDHIGRTDGGLVIRFGGGDRITLIGNDLDPLSVAADIFLI